MEIGLLIVSKQSSEIICRNQILLYQLAIPNLSELYERIHELYPTLYENTDYVLYWRYSKGIFLKILDFLSYLTVLSLMVDKSIYLILNDCDKHCEENEAFLRRLDEAEMVEQREKVRSKYDVTITRKGDMDGEINKIVLDIIEENIIDPDKEPRTDEEMLTYALRKLPEVKCFTADLVLKSNLIRDVKKGWPKLKLKTRLIPLPEEVIERARPKEKKGKKGKKDKKGKGKKKDGKKKKK